MSLIFKETCIFCFHSGLSLWDRRFVTEEPETQYVELRKYWR